MPSNPDAPDAPDTPDTEDGTDADNVRGSHSPADSGTGAFANLRSAVQAGLDRVLASHLAPGLYVVATPIGNLADVTLRALGVLARVDAIHCEDTRHSQRLLQHYGIARPLVPYHEHNAERERPRILDRLAAGARLALISDAGTPLISDPGYKLVRAAREAGHGVWSLPGPSAPIAALSTAGLPTDHFTFEGFLPSKRAARRTRLAALAHAPGTLVFFEAPQRLPECLADLAELWGARSAVVAREVTKLHEEFVAGTLPELAGRYADATVKGEVVLLVAPAQKARVEDAQIVAALDEALTTQSLRDAARVVAEQLDVSRSRVYDLGLSRRSTRDGS